MPNYPFYIFNSNAKFGLQWSSMSAKGNGDAIPTSVSHIGCSDLLGALEYVNLLTMIKDANYSLFTYRSIRPYFRVGSCIFY
jgi:hypothetical protein